MSGTNVTVEQMSTSAAGCGLTTASSLRRAICLAAERLEVDELLTGEEMARHFGTAAVPVGRKPTLVVVVAGVRGGKSVMASAAGIHAALTVDLAHLQHHELPRYAIVAPTVDAAKATFTLLTGQLRSSRALSQFVESETADTVVIKRADGRRVELVVVAAHRGGLSVRNRWLVGFVLDEVAQFGAEHAGYTVNAEELLRAARSRTCAGYLVCFPMTPSSQSLESPEIPGRFSIPSGRCWASAAAGAR